MLIYSKPFSIKRTIITMFVKNEENFMNVVEVITSIPAIIVLLILIVQY